VSERASGIVLHEPSPRGDRQAHPPEPPGRDWRTPFERRGQL